MKNKQHITICNYLLLQPVMDASLTGCGGISAFSFSTKRCIPNGMPFSVITYIFYVSKN
ncbi:MAG: hypothetical protein FWH18_12285 [Marinilabiliaceae bacterium]|nr:hypothetical protein [Marinilabiliaceae bacterium]